MHYLIDGHNLIGQMADIRLADPDDEERVVVRLRRWLAAGGKRRATVYFDGGLPGGRARHLSGGKLNVVFASAGQDADSLIIRRIQRVRNPPEFTLVTSDRAIVSAAGARGMPVIDSGSFANRLEEETGERRADAPAKEEPALNEEELAKWMKLFSQDEE